MRDTLAGFPRAVLRPRAREAEEARRTSDDVYTELRDMGVAAPVEEFFGGGGTFDTVTSCVAAEELAWGDASMAFHVLGSGLAATVIDSAVTDEQKRAHLPGFVEGPPRSFVAASSDASASRVQSGEESRRVYQPWRCLTARLQSSRGPGAASGGSTH